MQRTQPIPPEAAVAEAGVRSAEGAAAEDVRIAEVAAEEGDVHTAARVEWEEAAGARTAAGLRCQAEVIAVAPAVAVVGPGPGRRKGPAGTVRAV